MSRASRSSIYAVLAALTVTGVALAPGAAAADHVTFEFRGTVTYVHEGHPQAFGGTVQPGMTFDGLLTYDADAPGVPLPATEGEGFTYPYDTPPARVRIRLGDVVLRSVPSAPDIHVTVLDDFGGTMEDGFAWYSRHNEASGLHDIWDGFLFDFRLSNAGGTPLASAELPTERLDVTAFASNFVQLYGGCSHCQGPDPSFVIEGVLTSLERRGGGSRHLGTSPATSGHHPTGLRRR